MLSYPALELTKSGLHKVIVSDIWLYESDIKTKAVNLKQGDIVRLNSPDGAFAALAFYSPSSKIVLRLITREEVPFDQKYISKLFQNALDLRVLKGYQKSSLRLVFGDADGFPGLIVDRYLCENREHHVFVVQVHSGGAESFTDEILIALQEVSGTLDIHWNKTVVLLAQNVDVRKREGLEVARGKKVLWQGDNFDFDLSKMNVIVQIQGKDIKLFANLLTGQKTGLFLDQKENITSLISDLTYREGNIKVLDLFSYVGAWSSSIAGHLGERVSIECVDASKEALEFAALNAQQNGAESVKTHQVDIVQSLREYFPPDSFDIVILDPPGLIKKRADLVRGSQAYLKLNREAMKLVKPGGLFITCSCSGGLSEPEFEQIIAEAYGKSRLKFKWYRKGLQAFDHPFLPRLAGRAYLKAWYGMRVEK